MEEQSPKDNAARKTPKRARRLPKREPPESKVVDRYYPMRDIRRKKFEERCLGTALLARRKVMAATTIAELGTIEDMRRAIELLAQTLEGLVDMIVRVCADVRPE